MDNIIRAAKKKRQKRNYFTQETENAIVAYNESDSDSFKSAIYSREIHYPFYKLTQNIIHTFKFYYTDGVENLEDLLTIITRLDDLITIIPKAYRCPWQE